MPHYILSQINFNTTVHVVRASQFAINNHIAPGDNIEEMHSTLSQASV